MRHRGICAYILAWVLVAVSLIEIWKAVTKEWLTDSGGSFITLWEYKTPDGIFDFPSKNLCNSHSGFCASWKTASFLFTLVLVPDSLIFLALLFSFMLHHRKKTVTVVRYMAVFTFLSEVVGLFLWKCAYANIDVVMGHGHWVETGGHQNIIVSIACQIVLLLFMIIFRSIVREPSNDEFDIDSDDEYTDNIEEDTVSVPDDIPPDQVEFYIFNKRERRRRLAVSGL